MTHVLLLAELSKLQLWLTPMWVLSVGVTLGAIVLLALYGLLWIVSRQAAAAVPGIVRESVLLPISYVVLVLVALCLLTIPTMPARELLHSLRSLPSSGTSEVSITIPAGIADFKVPIAFHADNLERYQITSSQDLTIADELGKSVTAPLLSITGEETYTWTPASNRGRAFNSEVTEVFVANDSDSDAELKIAITTGVETPEVKHIPVIAGSVVGVYLAYLLLYALFPGLSTIAAATAKEAMSQPLFLLLLSIGACALVAFIYIPYNTFGEDVKMLKDSGLTTIMVLSILFALWTASVCLSDEIEGRTALTVLSKPVSRPQFILGKFLGIVWPVLLMFVVLGVIFLATISYKVVYDARETTMPTPEWQNCYLEMMLAIPGLVLAFLETVVLTAISVAISTRFSMVPNLILCGTIYTLGHLGPLIVQSSAGQNEFVAFFGKLIAVVLPVLEHFNIQAAVAAGVDVPLNYLAWALLYAVLYSTAAMLLALWMFEDRDLA